MRIAQFLLAAACCIGLIWLLNTPLNVNGSKTPRLGYFLSPQKGFWQNAEAVETDFSGLVQSNALSGSSSVYLDDRLVPHVYADNDTDVYFIQGYLHAKFRLWQMEFIAAAAGGRLSEIMGDSSNGTNFLRIDQYFRRLGMVYGAENELKGIAQDPQIQAAVDAYTNGVNAYIDGLNESSYPFEFKLLDYKPEQWTNLKTALIVKYMAFDLSGFEEDFERTNARSVFTKEQYEALYPYGYDSLNPIHPKGTVFPPAGIDMKIPAGADSVYFTFKDSAIAAVRNLITPDKENGSNNWAVSGAKTKDGNPILCNDPHLSLTLPSIWYEMHLSTPDLNVYGVSFPGVPTIPIGFNDSCAWGETNAERDVRDYYEIQFKDSTEQEYWFDSSWRSTTFRDEVIHIKNKPDDTIHLPMTVWGPVMYDAHFDNKLKDGKAYAVKWTAHNVSDEIRTFYLLNRTKSYSDYVNALSGFESPGQNFIFASKAGDIAIKQQGHFPARWRRQGDFVMPGSDSTYAWRGYIPDTANLIMHNPERGFVSSANQYPYDTTYPYYLAGVYPLYRGIIINRKLSEMNNITAEDMQKMQTDNYDVFAEMARPVLLSLLKDSGLTVSQNNYLSIVKDWNLRDDAGEKGATIFKLWWDSLTQKVYGDEYAQTTLPLPEPQAPALLDDIIKTKAVLFADDINTAATETMPDDILAALQSIVPVLDSLNQADALEWGKYKHSGVPHLLKIPALSNLNLYAGGGANAINAYKQFHGPSWRMVVELGAKTEAFGIYPGGQSGNPGSKYYSAFINDWVDGKYYNLLFLNKQDLGAQTTIKGVIRFEHI